MHLGRDKRDGGRRQCVVVFLFWCGHGLLAGKDAEKLLGFLGGFQIEIVTADDALGITRLKRCLADRPEFPDEHRNIRMSEHIVSEVELVFKLGPAFLEITSDYWIFIEWIRT